MKGTAAEGGVGEERENLPLMLSMLHKAFTEAGLDWEVVVVEDSSPDGTYEVALDLARVYGADHVKIHKRPAIILSPSLNPI